MRPSPHQIRLLVAQQVAPDSAALNHAVLLRPRGGTSVESLRAAVLAMASEHDSLRCRFCRGGPDGWMAVEGQPAVPTTNLVLLSEHDLPDRVRHEVDRPFDLSAEAPLRIAWWSGSWGAACQLTFHHVATDARTLDLLLQELRARCAEPRIALASAPAYYELAAEKWSLRNQPGHRERLSDYAADVASADLSPLLPPEDPGPARSATISWQLPDIVSTAAQHVAAEIESTHFVVWLTAWTRAVARLLDRWHFPMAVPISTRGSRAEMGVTGFFVNSVILPVHHEPNESFASAAARMRDVVLNALDRRDLPLHELAAELDLDARGVSNPLIAASCQLLPAPLTRLELSDSSVGVEYVESREPRYQISFEVRNNGTSNQGRLTIDTRCLEEARLPVLRNLIEAELCPVATAFSSSRFPQVVPTSSPPPGTNLLLDPVVASNAADPNATALEWVGGRWSRRVLADKVAEVEALLSSSGAGPKQAIVLDFPRGPQLVAALLGVLAADMVPVMARPGLTFGEHGGLDEQVGAALTLTSGSRGSVVAVPLPRKGPGNPRYAVPEGTAYVTFTSGSTGKPKGVPAPLAGVLEYLEWVEDATDLSPKDRCLQLAAPGFDALIRDTLAPLRRGAALVILPDEHRLSGPALRTAVVEGAVSAILAMTPPQLRRLLGVARTTDPIPGLRLLCVAGEPLFRSDLAGAVSAFPTCRILNLYGPTETTMTVTCMTVTEDRSTQERLPVGRSIRGSAVRVLDSHGLEVPTGCTGEVVVAGPGVAPAYLGAHRPRTNPFANRLVGGRLTWTYATGDRGYLLDDDAGLRLLGRLDSQRKVNGERVDLEAVEAAITSHPGVLDAVVRLEETGGVPLVVGTLAFHGKPLSHDELRRFLSGKVPAAGVPRRLVVGPVKRLPNGKLDRSGQPAPLTIGAPTIRYAGSATDEVALAVQQVLGSVPDDPTRSLLHSGLDSLHAVELLERLGVLTPTTRGATRFFDDPRMTTLVELVVEAATGDSIQHPPSAQDDTLGGLTWLSDGDSQKAPGSLVCFPQAGGDSPTFAPLATALEGVMNVAVFRRPPPETREGTVESWLDAHVHASARALSELVGPVVLCGYSVGFTLAFLVAEAAGSQHGSVVSRLVGINPGVPGATTKLTSDWSGGAPAPPDTRSSAQRAIADRLAADLCLRRALPVSAGRLPPVLLFQTPDDRRRFEASRGLLARFTDVEREELGGDHVLTKAEMVRIGRLLRERAVRWHEN